MLLILLLTFVTSVLAGTQCPPREDIYPCSCVSVPHGGKRIFFTTVSCHRLHSTDSLNNILPSLRAMTIDHFYLYDSFWEASNLGAEGENKQVLPADWLTILKIKEIEIVDTTLSSCFPCHSRLPCRNDFTTRFTAVNSSSHDKICTICESSRGSKFSWTGCMNKLQTFHFRHGKLSTVRADLFPLKMSKLTEVDLSYNSIEKIERQAFKNLPKLKILNLSHNALTSLQNLSTAKLEELQLLDISWNLFKELSPNFFAAFPKIKTLLANNNYMVDLVQEHWKDQPSGYLRTIDLSENPLNCDCSIQWVNSTFHVNVLIQGHCATPEEFENSRIRRASIALNQRCDKDGNIGTRKPKTKAQAPVTRATF